MYETGNTKIEALQKYSWAVQIRQEVSTGEYLVYQVAVIKSIMSSTDISSTQGQ